ncbi:MAG: DUF4397 domain-containing protein [Candidatus Krumholzibacteria bacterium]|jgi:hypothetical protein|nr:DUF4397 domain-containing protein [Candidatus Krumholzibacteria bacterium]
MNRMFNLILIGGLSAVLTFGLSGCSDDDDNPTRPPVAEKALLRVVHASPDAPAVDLYVNDGSQPLIQALGYGATSAYLEVTPATYTIQLRAHGADPVSEPVFSEQLVVTAKQQITAVAAGLLGSGAADDRFRILALVEDFSDPGTGSAAVRIVHAAPDAPSVALDIGNDGAPELVGFSRFAETGPAGVSLPAGTPLRVGVWAGEPLARASVFTTPSLPAGANLFLIATGLLGDDPAGTGFSLLAIGPTGSIGFIRQDAKATVYALHGSPDAPPVAIDANGVEVVSSLAFGGLSSALVVWPGAYDLDFRAAGTSAVAVSAATPYLEPGVQYLAIATGFLGGSPTFRLLPLADAFTGSPTDALVRVVHASPDAPAVDVGPVVAGAVAAVGSYTNLGFGQASAAAGTALPVGNLTVGVAATGTVTPVASFDVTTAAGLRAFAVACGSLGGTGESFRLLLVLAGDDNWAAVQVLPNR